MSQQKILLQISYILEIFFFGYHFADYNSRVHTSPAATAVLQPDTNEQNTLWITFWGKHFLVVESSIRNSLFSCISNEKQVTKRPKMTFLCIN